MLDRTAKTPRQGSDASADLWLCRPGRAGDSSIITTLHWNDGRYTRPGKRLHNYETSPFSMGKSTISMVIFNSFLYVYRRVYIYIYIWESSPKGRTFRVGVKQSRMIICQWCRYSIWWIMKFLDAQFPDKSSRCTESGVAWSKVYPQPARSDAWRPFRGTGVLRWSTMINLRILCLFMFIWLVVWDIWIIFPYMGIIIPTDFHIFQRGRHTTNQWLFISACAMDQTSWHPNLRTL